MCRIFWYKSWEWKCWWCGEDSEENFEDENVDDENKKNKKPEKNLEDENVDDTNVEDNVEKILYFLHIINIKPRKN